MYQSFLYNTIFHELLHAIDQEFVDKARQQGCSCGGKLYQADYPRSPLGLPMQFRHMYDARYSLCCAACRKRITPPSVRFFGRRWFPAPLLILICALSKGASDRRCAQVKRHLGIAVSKSTWRRWQRWWRKTFTVTPFWQQAKGLLIPMPHERSGFFPRTLLSVFQGNFTEKICHLLRFLSPLTAGALRAV